MDERTLTRKRRLQELIDGKPYLGNQSAFAEKAGLTKGRITQLLDPTESFGERSARSLAAALRLKDDYFDGHAESDKRAPPKIGEELAAALDVLTKVLQSADKSILIAVAPLLAAMAAEPDTAKIKSGVILKLLVTDADTADFSSHDELRSSHIYRRTPRLTLGDENGRSDTAAASSGRKK